MNTARSSVFASIHAAARSCAWLIATAGFVRCQYAMSPGEIADTASTTSDRDRRPGPDEPRRQDGDRDPHHLEVLVHVELDRADEDDVRQRGTGPTIQATRNHRLGRSRLTMAATIASANGHAEVGGVEEQDGERPVLESRLAPAQDELEAAGLALLEDRVRDERQGEHDRGEEEHGIAADRPRPPRPAGDHVQADDQVGGREGIELERREERGEETREQDAGRPAVEAC